DHQLVDLLLVEDAHRVDGVTDVGVALELHGLDEVAVAHQEHGDHSGEHAHVAPKFLRIVMPKAWLFSGWNCAPMTLPARIIEASGPPYVVVPSSSSARSGTTR